MGQFRLRFAKIKANGNKWTLSQKVQLKGKNKIEQARYILGGLKVLPKSLVTIFSRW